MNYKHVGILLQIVAAFYLLMLGISVLQLVRALFSSFPNNYGNMNVSIEGILFPFLAWYAGSKIRTNEENAKTLTKYGLFSVIGVASVFLIYLVSRGFLNDMDLNELGLFFLIIVFMIGLPLLLIKALKNKENVQPGSADN